MRALAAAAFVAGPVDWRCTETTVEVCGRSVLVGFLALWRCVALKAGREADCPWQARWAGRLCRRPWPHTRAMVARRTAHCLGSVRRAAESEVVQGGVGSGHHAGRHAVARAIVPRAEPAAAALDLLVPRAGALRVVHRGAAEVVRRLPVTDPFPDIAGHVVEAIAVGGELLDRPVAAEAVQDAVLVGEGALPEVGLVDPAGDQLFPPGVASPFESAAGGVLELRLCGQPGALPVAVGIGVLSMEVHNGVIRRLQRGRTGGS